MYHSLPNLSNKDKELLGEGAESRITPFWYTGNGRTGTGNGLYDAQGKERCKESSLEKKKKRKESCKCGDVEKREGISIYKKDRRLAKTKMLKNSLHANAFTLLMVLAIESHVSCQNRVLLCKSNKYIFNTNIITAAAPFYLCLTPAHPRPCI